MPALTPHQSLPFQLSTSSFLLFPSNDRREKPWQRDSGLDDPRISQIPGGNRMGRKHKICGKRSPGPFSFTAATGISRAVRAVGHCCMTAEGAFIMDAAHIEPWADTQNDDPGCHAGSAAAKWENSAWQGTGRVYIEFDFRGESPHRPKQPPGSKRPRQWRGGRARGAFHFLKWPPQS
jgi:hypothetical protein